MEKVIVRDEVCWYNGREAVVKSRNVIAGITVLWVAIPSGTGNATIEFAVREENTEKVA